MQKKLGSRLREIFTKNALDESFFEDIEDALIEADIGSAITMEISDTLRERAKEQGLKDETSLRTIVREIIGSYIKVERLEVRKDTLYFLLVLGVNGVGKTTTIAKLGHFVAREIDKGRIHFAAADTFRAAAIDQLQLHGQRLGIKVIAQEPGADPGAVVWDTIESVKAKGTGVIFADTAGRMHNKANLVKELQKIDKIVTNKVPEAVYKKILIVDATTGQNAYRQAELFNEAVPLDYAVLTKYDSSSKGGIAVSISKHLGIPFIFLGIGEGYEDLIPFTSDRYLDMLID